MNCKVIIRVETICDSVELDLGYVKEYERKLFMYTFTSSQVKVF